MGMTAGSRTLEPRDHDGGKPGWVVGLDDVESREEVARFALELAHHLNNSLTSVRAFVSGAGSSASGPPSPLRHICIADLERIDGYLEWILEFAQVQSADAAVDHIDLAQELERAVSMREDCLATKAVCIPGLPLVALPIQGDRSTLRYALRAVVDHVAADIAREERLTLAVGPHGVRLTYVASSTQAHLGALTGAGVGLSISLALAHASLRRLGAVLRFRREDRDVSIEIRVDQGP